MPLFGGCIFLTDQTNLVTELLAEFIVSDKKVIDQLFGDRFNIHRVSDLVNEVESLLLNTDIMVFKAISNNLSMSTDSIIVQIHNQNELLEGNVADIVFLVGQKTT